jgi:hypothetical protein
MNLVFRNLTILLSKESLLRRLSLHNCIPKQNTTQLSRFGSLRFAEH